VMKRQRESPLALTGTIQAQVIGTRVPRIEEICLVNGKRVLSTVLGILDHTLFCCDH
jgi:hypothetical protein